MKTKAFFLAIIILISIRITAQDTNPSKIYIDDFDAFINILEQTHPDPYTVYGGKVEFKRAVQSYRQEVLKITDQDKFYNLLNRFLCKLKDGHTSINNPRTAASGNARYLPIKFKIATDGLYISAAAPEYENLLGCRVTAVNSIPADSLLRKTMEIKACENIYDGYFSLASMLINSNSLTRLFPGESRGLKIDLKKPDNNSLTVDIPFYEKAGLAVKDSKLKINKPNGLLYWDMIGAKKDVGYFAWNSTVSRELVEQVFRDAPKYIENNLRWVYQALPELKRPENPEEAIKNVPALYEQFASLLEAMKGKNSEYLIIDLRYNSGGMTPLVPPLLYMLFGDKYLNNNLNLEYNRLLSPLFLNKIGFKSIEDYNKANNSNYKIGDYQFGSILPNYDGMSIEEKRSLRNITYSGFGARYVEKLNGKSIYTPKIIVLTNPATFSAAYQFTCFLQMIGGAKVVGVASRQAGNTFMENTPFELPNTHMNGGISNAVQIFFPGDNVKGNILTPEFPMKWQDFNKFGFDENAEILYALSLIADGSLK